MLKREKISRFPCNCNETDRKIIVNKRQLIAKVVNLHHTTTIKPLSLTSLSNSTKGVNNNASDKVNTAPKDFESFLSQFDFSDTCYTGKDFWELKACIWHPFIIDLPVVAEWYPQWSAVPTGGLSGFDSRCRWTGERVSSDLAIGSVFLFWSMLKQKEVQIVTIDTDRYRPKDRHITCIAFYLSLMWYDQL